MPENNHHWADIARNLSRGRTVLVLGPDAIPYYPAAGNETENGAEQTSFSQLSRRHIVQNLNGQISFISRCFLGVSLCPFFT